MLVYDRSAVVGAIGLGAVAGALVATAPSALADPPQLQCSRPGGRHCWSAAATSAYLFTHPDVNDFMTGLTGQPGTRCRPTCRSTSTPTRRPRPRSKHPPATADMRDRCGPPLLDRP